MCVYLSFTSVIILSISFKFEAKQWAYGHYKRLVTNLTFLCCTNLIDLSGNAKSTHSSSTWTLECLAFQITVHWVLFLPFLVCFIGRNSGVEVVLRLLEV